MATTSPILPRYLNDFLHPGLYCPQNPTIGLNRPNPKYQVLFTRATAEATTLCMSDFPDDPAALMGIMGNVGATGAIPSQHDGIMVKIRTKATALFKAMMMTSTDAPVMSTAIEEREQHESMLRALEAHLTKDLAALTVEDMEGIIRQIHAALSSGAGSYRTINVVIRKHFIGNFLKPSEMIPYLMKEDPEAVPSYRSAIDKMKLFYAVSLTRSPYLLLFYRDGNLTPEEKTLFDKYIDLHTANCEQIPMLMKIFIQKLLSRLQKKEDPIAIAAFAHMQIIAIHPYVDGNGRVARAVMNWILASAGLPPIAFVFNQEYTQAIQKTHDGSKQAFEDLIRKKVEESQADYAKDPAIVEARLAAQVIQTIWERVPKKTRQTFIRELFSMKSLLSAPIGSMPGKG